MHVKVYSTVLSRDAVAKTLPSGDHAPSQMIRVCDLSTASGTYPTSIGQAFLSIQATTRKKVPTGLLLLEQAPSSIARDG